MADAKPSDDKPDKSLTNRETYNVVTDTITGPNIRLKDNLFQGLAIVVCLLVGSLIGCFAVADRIPGALVGAFIGTVVGLLGSGLFLMIFRAVKHIRGRHN